MNLKQLDTFLWVVALKSFRKTAERLHATQPAVSSRIANLEDELGIRLFERDTGSVRLTTKGQELLPYVEQIMRVSSLLREKAGNQSDMTGVLRLGISETIVHTWLPKYLNKLHSNYPNIDLELSVDVTQNLRSELLSRTLDLAFLLGPISEYSISNVPLVEYPMSWVCAPSLGFTKNQKVTLEEILQFPIMTYSRNTRPYAEIHSFFKDKTFEPVRIFSSSSIAAFLKMALDGMGISVLPPATVEREMNSGALIELDFDWRPSNLVFTASYAKEPYNAVAERAALLAQDLLNEPDK